MSLDNITFLLLYLSPSIAGWIKKTPNLGRLIFFNAFCSWTIVGWYLAWGYVFPPLTAWFWNWLAAIKAKHPGYATQGAGMPTTNFQGGECSARICSQCGGGGRVSCSFCSGRGSWYTQPQTATETSQLVTCTHCCASGTVICSTCGGSGQIS